MSMPSRFASRSAISRYGLEYAFAHVRKSRAEALVVRSDQRICPLQIDVIANHHERALAVVEIDRAGGVGQNRGADPKLPEDAHREHHFLARISFVKVHAALHRGDRNVARLSRSPACRRALDCGAREAGNFLVGDARGGSEFVGERAESRAEHQRDFRAQFCFRENVFRGALGAGKFVGARRGFRARAFIAA